MYLSPVAEEVRDESYKGEMKLLGGVQQERRANAKTWEERGQLSRAQKDSNCKEKGHIMY